MKKLFNKIRRKLAQKLIRPDDGYTYTGFSEGQPLKFYYQEDTGKYLVGKRSDNWYYFELKLDGWHSYASKYLPWGKTVEKCVWNSETQQMDDYTYNQEPKEVDFQKWLYGISVDICKQCNKWLVSTDVDDFIEAQEAQRKWEERKNALANRKAD